MQDWLNDVIGTSLLICWGWGRGFLFHRWSPSLRPPPPPPRRAGAASKEPPRAPGGQARQPGWQPGRPGGPTSQADSQAGQAGRPGRPARPAVRPAACFSELHIQSKWIQSNYWGWGLAVLPLFNLERCAQPLGDPNFQRAFRSEQNNCFWDSRPSIWSFVNRTRENWPCSC